MANTTDLVTSWKLDSKQFEKALKGQLSNIKAGIDMIGQFGGALAGAVDKLATSGAELDRLASANTLSINKAAEATRGYVSKVDLLKAANMSAAFGLGQTERSFAKLAEASVIMSQRLGVDANYALSSLITGLSRQSKVLLDNLGIVVSVEKANQDYAASVNKTTTQLTDAEKKTAFMNATLAELNRLVGDSGVEVKSAGDQYEILKTQLGDATAELGRAIIKSDAMIGTMKLLTEFTGNAAKAFGVFSSEVAKSGKSMAEALRAAARVAEIADVLVPMGKGRSLQQMLMGMANANEEIGAMQEQAGWTTAIKTGNLPPGVTPPTSPKKAAVAAKRKARGRGAKGPSGKSYDLAGDTYGLASMDTSLGMPTAFDMLGGQMLDEGAMVDAAQGIADIAQKYQLQRDAANQAADAQRKLNESIRNAPFEMMKSAAVDFATGMVGVFDAVIQGEKSFGEAMLSMLKSLAFSVMGMAAVQALQQYAEGTAALATTWGIPNPKSIAHFAAAGMFTALAGGAALAGLGISGIQAATSGGSSSGGSGSKSSSGSSRDYSSSFSGTKTKKSQPINVNVYVGEPGDPSAALMMQKQLKAQLAA